MENAKADLQVSFPNQWFRDTWVALCPSGSLICGQILSSVSKDSGLFAVRKRYHDHAITVARFLSHAFQPFKSSCGRNNLLHDLVGGTTFTIDLAKDAFEEINDDARVGVGALLLREIPLGELISVSDDKINGLSSHHC